MQPKTMEPKTNSLAQVLHESEQAKGLVEECADDLSSVNKEIEQQLQSTSPLFGVASALEKNKAIEDKVQEVTGKIAVVNDGLAHEVRGRVMLEHQLAAAVEQEKGASQAALHDVLTGLPNRSLFHDRLEHGLAQAIRHHWTLAVMFLDLDDFKKINDSYGHDAGDSVLQAVAARLKEITRIDDTVSRYGGDEFLYLLMQAQDKEHLAVIAQNIIQTIQAPCAVTAGDEQMHVSVRASIGIALFPKNGVSAETLVKSADGAMYRAKQNKAGYSFAD